MFEAIKRHPKRTLFVTCMILTILAVIFISNILKNFFNINFIYLITSEEEQQIFILGISLNNWCTILTILGVIVGGVWGLIQYDKNIKLRQQEKASEIATQFSNEIVNKLSTISHILTQNERFQKILAKVDADKLCSFSIYEIYDITGDKYIIDKYNLIINSNTTQNEYEKFLNENFNEDERKKYDSKFTRLIETTLNQLEAVCMNISSQAAGSQYIYQSLHQIFLYNIHVLSIKISQNNKNNFDKYFTNTIAVYNTWNNQKKRDKIIFNKTAQKIKKLEDKRDSEIKKLLNKKPRTV